MVFLNLMICHFEMTLAITKHNNPLVYEDFQAQGGKTIDLAKDDSSELNLFTFQNHSWKLKGLICLLRQTVPASFHCHRPKMWWSC